MSLSIMGGTTHQYSSILLVNDMISIQFLIDALYNTLYDTLATYQKSKIKEQNNPYALILKLNIYCPLKTSVLCCFYLLVWLTG